MWRLVAPPGQGYKGSYQEFEDNLLNRIPNKETAKGDNENIPIDLIK